jgi:DNA-binding transcriptional ArsR family regulator
MDVTQHADVAAARIAHAIGEPARARMLYRLMDGRARTSTELALVADVRPPTASSHLARLLRERLVRVHVQGKHRYYSLVGQEVAGVLEALSGLAGADAGGFAPSTPDHLRAARTCYDHIAGTLGVALHDRFVALEWMRSDRAKGRDAYDLTARGAAGLAALGVPLDDMRRTRRRFAFACLDWSERRAHVGGAVGAALLTLFVKRRWVKPERDGRALEITGTGKRELGARFGVGLASVDSRR